VNVVAGVRCRQKLMVESPLTMAAGQQHTAWRIAYYVFLSGVCSIAAIDYLHQRRMVLTLLCCFGTYGGAFEATRRIVRALSEKHISKQNPSGGSSS
jgi:hypothetical protein